jgi:hypothetical protein
VNRLATSGARVASNHSTALLVLAALPLAALAGTKVGPVADQFGTFKFIWVILTAFGGLVAVVNLRVGMAVLLLCLAFPFRTKVLFGLEIHTTQLVEIAVIAVALSRASMQSLSVRRGMGLPISLMVAGGVAGAIAGPDLGGSLERLFVGLVPALAIMVIAAASLHPDRDLRPLLYVTAFALAGTGIVALLQSQGHTLPGVPLFEQGRVNGFFFHPNILGGYLSATTLLLIGAAAFARKGFRTVPTMFIAPIVFGLAGMGVTLSRGALVGFAVGLVVIIGFVLTQRRLVSVLGVMLVIVLSIAAAVPQISPKDRQQYAERFAELRKPGAETGRSLIYRVARDTALDHPLTGIGPLAFGKVMRSSPLSPGFVGGATHSHSVLFEGFLSLGPIGFAGFVLLVIASVRRLLAVARPRSRHLDPVRRGWALGSLAALTALAVQGMVDFIFWQVELLVYVFLLLGIAWTLMPEDDDRRAAP